MKTRTLPSSLLLFILAAPAPALAQNVHLPIVGRQFFTVGPEFQAGAVVDYRDEPQLSLATGPRLRVGIHHIITRNFAMNAELSAGATYFADHIMAPHGQGQAQIRPDWRLSVLARRKPVGHTQGWTFAGGLDYRQAHLKDGRLVQFGLDARLGRYLWTQDERFIILELGLHAPIWEGLVVKDFTGELAQTIPDKWIFPSMSLAIQWAF